MSRRPDTGTSASTSPPPGPSLTTLNGLASTAAQSPMVPSSVIVVSVGPPRPTRIPAMHTTATIRMLPADLYLGFMPANIQTPAHRSTCERTPGGLSDGGSEREPGERAPCPATTG